MPKPFGVGVYKTRSGKAAIVQRIGWTGKLYGRIEGTYTSTWWKRDGTHNSFLSDDLVGPLEPEQGARDEQGHA